MPSVNPGEVWMTDFGMAPDELDLVTVLLHTTALRGNMWELNIPKPSSNRVPSIYSRYLQQVQTISTVKLERRLGSLTAAELRQVLDALGKRLGI